MVLHCLVVDDSASFLQAARVVLEREGLTVEVAMTSAEALRRVDETQPDVVLVDIHLPGMNGIKCVAGLKTRLPELSVLMLTRLEKLLRL